MSLYSVTTILMFFFSIIIYEVNAILNLNKWKISLDKAGYLIFGAILFVMLTLCDDRSPDFRAYKNIYGLCPTTINFQDSFYTALVHTEFGWKLLNNIFKASGFTFEWFVAVITGISILFLNSFILKYCNKNKLLGLFWLYGSFCLSYFYIGIRMGLSISLFLGILLPLLEERKYIKYLFGVLICTSFHTVSILYILLIIVKRFTLSNLYKHLIVCFILGIGMMVTGLSDIMYTFVPATVESSLGYGMDVSIDLPVVQFLYRCFFLIIALYCYYNDKKNRREYFDIYKYYFSGIMFYFLFSGIPILCTRVFDMVKPLETVFICSMIGDRKTKNIWNLVMFIIALSLCVFMVFFHISAIKSYFPETSYYSVFSFPFRSILDN